jgi:hypothetical protein
MNGNSQLVIVRLGRARHAETGDQVRFVSSVLAALRD